MAIVEYAQTDSFTIQHDTSFSDAERRAAALTASVEHDLRVFFEWFGFDDAFGPSDRCTVLVGQPQGGEACNFGYQAGGHSLIQVNPAQGWDPDPRLQLLLDDCVRGMWAMEFAEVMMSLDNQRSGQTNWHPAASNGEGLSLLCGETLYPAAMYGIGTQGYPRSGQWFAATPRPNWADTTEGTDRHPLSWGCSIACLSYMTSQLGHSLEQVIQARGATLEQTYRNLTGMSGLFDAMTGVVEPFFPTGGPVQPRTDDPFPLYPDGARRTVTFSVVEQELSRTALPTVPVTRPLPFPCRGDVDVRFTPYDVSLKLTVQAIPLGFANPQFAWTIAGAPVNAAGPLTVEVPVVPNDPLHPNPPLRRLHSDLRSLTVIAGTPTVVPPGTLEQAGSGQFEVTLPAVGGSIDLPLSCTVTDAAPTVLGGGSTGLLHRGYQTRQVVWDEHWLQQAGDCRARAGKLAGPLFKPIFGQIMPDPAPDFVRAMEQLRELLAELQVAREKKDTRTADTLTGVMRDYLNVPAAVLGVPAQTPPRLAPAETQR